MKENGEIVFSDLLQNYCDEFENLKKEMFKIKDELESINIDRNQEGLLIMMNSKISKSFVELYYVFDKLSVWFKQYIEEMNTLNNGFVNPMYSSNNQNLLNIKRELEDY